MAYVIDSRITLIISLMIILVCFLLGYLKSKKEETKYEKRDIMKLLFAAYLLIIASFTLFPILVPPMHTEELQYNIDVRHLFRALADRASLIDVAGNVMLFIPVGIIGYLAELKSFKSIKSAVVFSLALSMCIEMLQGVETYLGFADFSTVVDINDIITNTTGGVIGYILIRTYRKES